MLVWGNSPHSVASSAKREREADGFVFASVWQAAQPQAKQSKPNSASKGVKTSGAEKENQDRYHRFGCSARPQPRGAGLYARA